MRLCIGQGRTRDTLNIVADAMMHTSATMQFPGAMLELVVKDYSDWKTIDIFAGYKPDECYDVTECIREEDASVETIRMGDVLEHFPPNRVGFVLAECRRVLRSRGMLLISVPDMTRVMPRWLADPFDRECRWLIWGEQDESGDGANASADTHRCGFTEHRLLEQLRAVGFKNPFRTTVHGTWYELAVKAVAQ